MSDRTLETLDLLAAHGLPPDGFLIAGVQIDQWGRSYRLPLLVDDALSVRAMLVFEDVRRAHWEAVGDDDLRGRDTVQVIGFDPGEPDGHRPAIITTDLFELHLTYQQRRLVND
jgi:hypothetical protein